MVGDRVDETGAEILPAETELLNEPDGHGQHPPLPWRIEHELAVVARQRGDSAHLASLGPNRIAQSRCTPIIASRLTSTANSSSVAPSLPAGRSGSTM